MWIVSQNHQKKSVLLQIYIPLENSSPLIGICLNHNRSHNTPNYELHLKPKQRNKPQITVLSKSTQGRTQDNFKGKEEVQRGINNKIKIKSCLCA